MQNIKMDVVKRDGRHEEVQFDKVLERIRRECTNLQVNPTMVSQKVLAQIVDKISTTELDNLTGSICANWITLHPDYGTLAARIAVSNHQKNTPDTFSQAVDILASVKDIDGNPAPVVSREIVDLVMMHGEEIDAHINQDRDYLFDYFGFKTLEKAYLLRDGDRKIIERPQYMFMRVALELWGENLEKAFETYDMTSQKFYTHATPTLFNAGTPRPQMSSCFLLSLDEDSMKGIYKTLSDCAQISKHAGGIGLHLHNLRARGSTIRGTNGVSNGIVPMLRVFNATSRYVDQGGKRAGSFAIYLEPWHMDITDFIKMKLNTGSEEERARDLFYALWIPDMFMRRVAENGDWTLFCPNKAPGLSDVWGDEFDTLYTKYEDNYKAYGGKQIKAQKLWFDILESQIETGGPYMLYKDAANRKSNQQNLGTIKSSNLCVAPETPLLTDKGYFPIASLKDQSVNVWNGDKWSNVDVVQTGTHEELVQVHLSDGSTLDCTPYHKFLISNNYNDRSSIASATRVAAAELEQGMYLRKTEMPIVEGSDNDDIKYPYTAGFFTGDGTYGPNHIPCISLYSEKKKLIDKLEVLTTSVEEDASGRINIEIPLDIAEKFTVPINSSLSCRLKWLAGYLDADADGTVARNGTNESIQVASINLKFLQEVRLLLTTLGVQPKISMAHDIQIRVFPSGHEGTDSCVCKPLWRLLISYTGLNHLASLGLEMHRLKFIKRDSQSNAEEFVQVVSVVKTGRIDDTYCFNESFNHAGVFNGVLTGNCTEILEFSNKHETAVCNLASIALPMFTDVATRTFNFTKLREVTAAATRNLNRVIDRNFYPTDETKLSNSLHRPIGMGVQGLADVFAMMKLSWESEEAKQLNKEIFAHIYYAAVSASSDMAKEGKAYKSFGAATENSPEGNMECRPYGEHEQYTPCPAAKGLLQPDLWEVDPVDHPDLDWVSLRERVQRYGMANSLLVAPMPTASTSQILGFNECIEPFTNNIYTRRTLAGEFIVVNKHLMRDLLEKGLWNPNLKDQIIANKGSVQGLDQIPEDLQSIYKTVWEIKQKTMIDMAADRGAYICQSQSLNLFVADPDYAKLSSMHMYTWRKGLKTGIYYLRTKSGVTAQQFTIDPTLQKNGKQVTQEEPEQEQECLMCSS